MNLKNPLRPNNMNKTNTPQIRFKGFTEAWEQRKLGEVVGITFGQSPNGVNYTNNPEDYILVQGNADMKNNRVFPRVWTTQVTKTADCGDLIFSVRAPVGEVGKTDYNVVIGRGVASIKGNDFIYQSLIRMNLNGFWKSFSSGSTFESINSSDLKNATLFIPREKEQLLLGSFFNQVDNLITLHQRKCEMLQKTKKALLEKMFPQNGSAFPEVRFKGFTETWEQRKLGELMNVTSVKRIHQSDWTTEGVRFLRARDIVSAAKNEEVDYLYISKQKYEEYSALSGKVSVGDLLVTGVGTIGIPLLIKNLEPVYFKDGNIIWFQNGEKIESDFFYYSFVAKAIQNFIKDSSGIGTVGTYTIENGKKTPIFLPEKAEQKAVGAFFTHLDHLITLHQRELEKLQKLKSACLQKMFV
jgi:type I restriction enzyme S subunit